MPTYLEPILYNQFVIMFSYMLFGMLMDSKGMVATDKEGNQHNIYSVVIAQCLMCLLINSLCMIFFL